MNIKKSTIVIQIFDECSWFVKLKQQSPANESNKAQAETEHPQRKNKVTEAPNLSNGEEPLHTGSRLPKVGTCKSFPEIQRYGVKLHYQAVEESRIADESAHPRPERPSL